jgi:hypothetical protein
MDTDRSIINDSTEILSNKYNTVGDVKKADRRSATQVITRMNPGEDRDHLVRWAFTQYYYPKNDPLTGNLTQRLRRFNNKLCYSYIVQSCFDGVDPLPHGESVSILTTDCKHIIQQLHNITPSGTGVFMDYLIRRIISEIKQCDFTDTRTESLINTGNTTIISETQHVCGHGCKNCMEQTLFRGEYQPKRCIFPYCQNQCYKMVKDTKLYMTGNILVELWIVSCCHTEAFGACPSQNKFNQAISLLRVLNTSTFLNPLVSLCQALIKDRSPILLNPALGSKNTPIPADCDVVIGDLLIDLKCTKSNDKLYEMLQLLGYSSMLTYNQAYNLRIHNICICNLLQGECRVYNITNISNTNLLTYLDLLTNRYNIDKPHITKTIKPIHPDYQLLFEICLADNSPKDITDRIITCSDKPGRSTGRPFRITPAYSPFTAEEMPQPLYERLGLANSGVYRDFSVCNYRENGIVQALCQTMTDINHLWGSINCMDNTIPTMLTTDEIKKVKDISVIWKEDRGNSYMSSREDIKQIAHMLKRQIWLWNNDRYIKYGEEFDGEHIALVCLEQHYFTNWKVPITNFALKNYEKIKDKRDWFRINKWRDKRKEYERVPVNKWEKGVNWTTKFKALNWMMDNRIDWFNPIDPVNLLNIGS